jgi:predicted permease
MGWWRLAWLRLRSVFRRDRVDDELERELALHFEQLVREQMDAGLPEAEARRRARLAFGSPEAVTEGCRDARRFRRLEIVARDVRYALRLLARAPGFTATALISLALGIGVNTAVFSVVDAVLVRSLPVDRPHDLVFVQAAGTAGPSGAPPYPCFERFRAETTAFAGMAAFASDDLRIVIDGAVEQAFGQVASGNYFEVLGVKPALGRVFTAADEALDPAVAVVGYAYAQRRFGGAARAIGRTIAFRDRVFTIVGVTPPEFWGLQPGRQVDVTIPITQDRAAMADPGNWWFDAVARLRAGVPVREATTQANTVFQSFMRNEQRARPLGERGDGDVTKKYFDHIELRPAAQGLERLRDRYSMSLYALTVVSALVLLIACTNLGSLLLVRGAARRHEFAIRLATGAGAGRLFSQLLTETLVLFAIAASIAPLVAQLATRALTGFFAIGRNPVVLDIRYDWRLIAFAVVVTLAAGVLTGVWPAIRAIRTDPQPAVKDGDHRVTGGKFGLAARMLVAGQVALAVVLLVAASLFVRTILNLRAVDLGFHPAGVLTMSIDPILPTSPALPDQAHSSRHDGSPAVLGARPRTGSGAPWRAGRQPLSADTAFRPRHGPRHVDCRLRAPHERRPNRAREPRLDALFRHVWHPVAGRTRLRGS